MRVLWNATIQELMGLVLLLLVTVPGVRDIPLLGLARLGNPHSKRSMGRSGNQNTPQGLLRALKGHDRPSHTQKMVEWALRMLKLLPIPEFLASISSLLTLEPFSNAISIDAT